MNPIISGLSIRPSDDFHQKKLLLNEEFHNKSKIQGLVSYIYYPSQREHPIVGHAELEIEGCSYVLMTPFETKPRSLPQMIKSTQSGHGYPFLRFHISVTPNQLQDLKKNRTWGIPCSRGVANALSRHGKYTIPLPITFSPFASAIYLASAKMLDSQRISKIDFYGGKKYTINFLKSVTGIAFECLAISSVIKFSYNIYF